jgi:anti-sigma factor (TIGR02949 family)
MNEPPLITCHQALARLWEYIDGELPPASQDDVRRHLERCNECFPDYDFRRAYLRLIDRHTRSSEPVQLRHRVFLQLLEADRSG